MKILLIDDHNLFLLGLEKIIQENFPKAEIFSCNQIRKFKDLKYDLIEFDFLVSDIEIPGENIFDFLRYFKKANFGAPILIVSMHNKLSVIKKCKFELSIPGYILKDDLIPIPEVMEKLLKGEIYYSERALETLEILDKKEKLLTPKEEEIIKLLVQGKNNTQISQLIHVSYNTVKTHRKNINRKLGFKSITDLVNYYYDNYI